MGIGKVYIVGAGPGSPDLITLRGIRALRESDFILLDKLLPKSFLLELDVASHDKEIVWLGETAARMEQHCINRKMKEAAQEGKTIVRLKTGDPFVFGRGSEELQFLSEHGIPWEVIPGMSVCTAGPAAAGLALTTRRESRSFAVTTARGAGGKLNKTYPEADSLLVFMGVSVLRDVVTELRRHGWSEDTPVAILERAELSRERRVCGRLSTIYEAAEKQRVHSPAVILVGRAASAHHASRNRPRILFTGIDPTGFRILGDLLHWPALKVVRNPSARKGIPADVVRQLREKRFHWTVFTSRINVRCFFEALFKRNCDVRILDKSKIATSSPDTATALKEFHVRCDYCPDEPASRGLLEYPELHDVEVLLVQEKNAPPHLTKELRRRKCSVRRLWLYDVVPDPELGDPLPEHDIVYFTSPSGVRAYWQAYKEKAFRKAIWTTGSVTAKEIEKLGFYGEVVQPYVSSQSNAALQTV